MNVQTDAAQKRKPGNAGPSKSRPWEAAFMFLPNPLGRNVQRCDYLRFVAFTAASVAFATLA